LMVTTSVRMLNGVHGNTSNSRPAVSLNLVLVVLVTCLHDWLVNSASSRDHTNHGTARTVQSLSGTGWKSDSGLLAIIGVTDNDSTAAGSLSQGTSVTNLTLEIANNRTLRDLVDWQNVADSQLSGLTAVDELTSVHTLGSDEVGLNQLVSVWVTEDNTGNWSTSTWVVEDILDNTLDITVSLGVVESSQLGSSLSVSSHSLEDVRTTLTLCSNDSSHKRKKSN